MSSWKLSQKWNTLSLKKWSFFQFFPGWNWQLFIDLSDTWQEYWDQCGAVFLRFWWWYLLYQRRYNISNLILWHFEKWLYSFIHVSLILRSLCHHFSCVLHVLCWLYSVLQVPFYQFFPCLRAHSAILSMLSATRKFPRSVSESTPLYVWGTWEHISMCEWGHPTIWEHTSVCVRASLYLRAYLCMYVWGYLSIWQHISVCVRIPLYPRAHFCMC